MAPKVKLKKNVDPDEPRPFVIGISEREKTLLLRVATAEGISLSAFIRRAAVAGAKNHLRLLKEGGV